MLNEEEFGPIINLYEDHAFNLLIRLYEFLTKNKVAEVFFWGFFKNLGDKELAFEYEVEIGTSGPCVRAENSFLPRER